MTSNDGNTKPRNSTLLDQTLLKALQDVIVRVVDPEQKNDLNQIHLGPEAGKLITALQEFISSTVMRSQPQAQNTIKVSLEEGESKFDDPDGDGEDDESPEKGSSSDEIYGPESDNDSKDLDVLEALQTSQSTFQEELLRASHKYIFNSMLIRLLCFEHNGESGFQISLIERGAVYARLVSILQEKMHSKELFFKKRRSGTMETDRQIIKQLIFKYAQYAILSHIWLRTTSGEVIYSNFNQGLLDNEGPGYRKLVNFCKAAWKEHRLTFGWMDTVCINKESSSELDESIRSMYNWYNRASVCIVYLAETTTLSDMHADPWFTRGWTLQELAAPDVIKFYNADWKQFIDSSDNDKRDAAIVTQIKQATTISQDELKSIRWRTSISRKMQLAATREVTREEDTSYSLMGIFDISLSTAYGEGAQHAFSRLLQAILASSGVLDILNCAGPRTWSHNSHILPSSLQSYINCSSNENLVMSPMLIEPLTLSHLGLRLSIPIFSVVSIIQFPFLL